MSEKKSPDPITQEQLITLVQDLKKTRENLNFQKNDLENKWAAFEKALHENDTLRNSIETNLATIQELYKTESNRRQVFFPEIFLKILDKSQSETQGS